MTAPAHISTAGHDDTEMRYIGPLLARLGTSIPDFGDAQDRGHLTQTHRRARKSAQDRVFEQIEFIELDGLSTWDASNNYGMIEAYAHFAY